MSDINWPEMYSNPQVAKVRDASAAELDELLAEQNAKTYNVYNGPVYNGLPADSPWNLTAQEASDRARATQDANRAEHEAFDLDRFTTDATDAILSQPDGAQLLEDERMIERVIKRIHKRLDATPDTLEELTAQEYLVAKAREDAKARIKEERMSSDDVGAYEDAGNFIFDIPDGVPAVWGEGDHVLWAEGEALMIAGSAGLGKTTLTGQLVRARLGLQESVLGLPVARGAGKVLYLAMDRPRQIARSLRRHFTLEDREVVSENMVIWQGPPIEDMASNDRLLVEMCQMHGADTVIVDSIKDAAIGLTNDEVGAGWNRSVQNAIRAGVEVLEMHHLVKKNSDGNAPTKLADVYGSTWLTAGVGSVILLHGVAGNPEVNLLHLKQPAEVVGPWKVQHDHKAGTSSVVDDKDSTDRVRIVAYLQEAGESKTFGIQKATGIRTSRLEKLLAGLVEDAAIKKSGTEKSPDWSVNKFDLA